jgi:cell division septum initiation protein DivIVA
MPDFPKARQGYDRSAVDSYLSRLTRELAAAQRDNVSLRADLEGLSDSVNAMRGERDAVQAQYDRLRTEGVDARAQDILDAAEQRAREIVAEGERAAEQIVWEAGRRNDVLDERSRQEHAWRRRQLSQERAELTRQQQALRQQLASFRTLAVDTATQFPDLSELSFADVVSSVTDPAPAEQHV